MRGSGLMSPSMRNIAGEPEVRCRSLARDFMKASNQASARGFGGLVEALAISWRGVARTASSGCAGAVAVSVADSSTGLPSGTDDNTASAGADAGAND